MKRDDFPKDDFPKDDFPANDTFERLRVIFRSKSL
jgi:hypothetical protein